MPNNTDISLVQADDRISLDDRSQFRSVANRRHSIDEGSVRNRAQESSHSDEKRAEQMKDALVNLQYNSRRRWYDSQGKWVNLPDWCISYIELGLEISQIPPSNKRTVLALAVPTRRYVSMFVALGAILATSIKTQSSDEYARFIASHAIGTPVIYQKAGKRLKGNIERFYKQNNQQFITIKTGKKEQYSFPLREYATKIIIAEREFKLSDYQKGGKVTEPSDFLSACIEDADTFMSHTLLACVIIGKLSQLRAETMETVVGIEHGKNRFLGTPQDILRIKEFLGANQAYRCQVVAGSSEIESQDLKEVEASPIVIFDGAAAFLRHSFQCIKAHQVVILDRTERAFADAVASVNQSHLGRVEAEGPPFHFNLPSGVEAMVFQEVVS